QGPASLRILEWPASASLAPSCVFCCCTPNRSWSHGDGDHPIGTVYLLPVGGSGGGNLAPPACPRDRSGTRRRPVAGLGAAGRGGSFFLALVFAGADGTRVVGGG